mmetsp:Transcript_8870/g.21834  ORF Transcript_8870/g.21834 Transcript_8870/m.21834 type:complete len:252 (-) Transcript_8870:873-1628(-)
MVRSPTSPSLSFFSSRVFCPSNFSSSWPSHITLALSKSFITGGRCRSKWPFVASARSPRPCKICPLFFRQAISNVSTSTSTNSVERGVMRLSTAREMSPTSPTTMPKHLEWVSLRTSIISPCSIASFPRSWRRYLLYFLRTLDFASFALDFRWCTTKSSTGSMKGVKAIRPLETLSTTITASMWISWKLIWKAFMHNSITVGTNLATLGPIRLTMCPRIGSRLSKSEISVVVGSLLSIRLASRLRTTGRML